MFEELRNACRPGMTGGFLPGKIARSFLLITGFERDNVTRGSVFTDDAGKQSGS